MPEPHLVLDALAKTYGEGPPAVAALSLQVAPGELLGVLGPSGCGKTTTLRMIGGLSPATSGRIVVAGRDVTAACPPRVKAMRSVSPGASPTRRCFRASPTRRRFRASPTRRRFRARPCDQKTLT
jgi:ABC-type multidrug transport system ATPase subunit